MYYNFIAYFVITEFVLAALAEIEFYSYIYTFIIWHFILL